MRAAPERDTMWEIMKLNATEILNDGDCDYDAARRHTCLWKPKRKMRVNYLSEWTSNENITVNLNGCVRWRVRRLLHNHHIGGSHWLSAYREVHAPAPQSKTILSAKLNHGVVLFVGESPMRYETTMDVHLCCVAVTGSACALRSSIGEKPSVFV